jgi:hypothetical protein
MHALDTLDRLEGSDRLVAYRRYLDRAGIDA